MRILNSPWLALALLIGLVALGFHSWPHKPTRYTSSQVRALDRLIAKVSRPDPALKYQQELAIIFNTKPIGD